jgi:pimeloyl-ACP methyl ester carboxylesterase
MWYIELQYICDACEENWMRTRKRWAPLLLLLPLLAVGGFVLWAYTPLGPMPEALAALESGPEVQVEAGPWLVFTPAGDVPATGLVLYPGGRVDPRAYAPAARAIAAEGHVVVIVPMPFNLAVTGAGRAADVISAFPQVERWAVGGHSLGGAMACRFARQNPSLVDGLVLWASYPASSDDLSGSGLQVVSIYGTRDGLATLDEIDASRALLPAGTRWVAIEGGNHGQFGWYGVQNGDNPAAISREAQQAEIVEATLQLLADL